FVTADAACADRSVQRFGAMTIAAARDGQAEFSCPVPQLAGPGSSQGWILDFHCIQAQIAQGDQSLPTAMIGRVRPARNAAGTSYQSDRCRHGQSLLWQRDPASISEVAAEGVAHRAGSPCLHQ